MNITSIDLCTYTVAPPDIIHASFALGEINQSKSYILKGATGLDAEEVVSLFYGMAQGANPATRYYNMTPKSRTVVLLIKLNPQYELNESFSSLREKLYKAIAYTRRAELELRFMDSSTKVASLFGFITKFEASLFTDEPEVQITLECKYPLLRSSTYITVTTGLALPGPAWTDGLSTAPHGFLMEMTFTAADVNPVIQGIYGVGFAPFRINYTFAAGDLLKFSSEDDNRYLTVTRAGVTTNLGDKIGQGSIWPMMLPGTTRIGFSTANLTVNKVSYRTAYWGL